MASGGRGGALLQPEPDLELAEPATPLRARQGPLKGNEWLRLRRLRSVAAFAFPDRRHIPGCQDRLRVPEESREARRSALRHAPLRDRGPPSPATRRNPGVNVAERQRGSRPG